jgi:hypothetical protein
MTQIMQASFRQAQVGQRLHEQSPEIVFVEHALVAPRLPDDKTTAELLPTVKHRHNP